MALSSEKDVDKEHCDNNFSKSARLQTTDDYILSEFLDFPQFSPEVHLDSLYSSKTEADCWENANQISKSTECNNSINKMNNASVGSLIKLCFADAYPEIKTNRDNDVLLHDTFLSDDLSALVFNTSTFDAFDYIEESESSVSMGSRCVETDFQSSKFSSSSQCFSYIGGCLEDISDRSDCQGDSELENCHAEQLPSINCCSWQADNIHMNLTSSQSNRFETVGTAVDEQANTHTENEGTIWSNWSVMTPEYDKNIPKEQSYGTNAFSANTVLSILKANVGACTSSQNNAYISHRDNSSPPLTEVIGCKSESSNQINVSELTPGARSVDNTQLVQKNGQSVHQREDIDSALRNMTEISFVSMSEQTELPFSADMTIDLWNAGSQCYELKNTMPVSNRMNTATEHQCTVHTEKPPSESINSSHLSDLQANREDNIHSLASHSETYMKVGKRGRYVALPAKNVNKLMVRELLCMSGNKEEMSIRDMTQDYRNNIRRILQQKHKRLNHLEC